MPEAANYPKVAQLKDVAAFRVRLAELGLSLPVDDRVLSAAEGSPLAQPMTVGGLRGRQSLVHPSDGRLGRQPRRLAQPAHAAAVAEFRPQRGEADLGRRGGGRAARWPGESQSDAGHRIEPPRACRRCSYELTDAHREAFGSLDGLLVGLQLTHSGRFCKPDDHHKIAPRIAYHHPLLDAKFKIDPRDDSIVWTDAELEQLIDDYVAAARLAHEVGFQFVDVKACHGYLLHEFLSARHRPGRFGGDLAGRSRVLLTIIDRIRSEIPHLAVGVRLSVFDSVPYQTSREVGRPMDFDSFLPYEYGFGVSADDPLAIDLAEPLELMRMLVAHGVAVINLTCGSPYYNPHMQRPAIFPPSDGYQPPEDPLVGVWRQIDAVRQCKAALPDVPLVGTGYTYLQDYLPHVAQAVVREGWVDFVGLGRMVLSYPELPADTLAGRPIERKRICRTFSDCTTAPRNGLISGCYPLDPYYKALPEREELLAIKQRWQS